MSRAKRLIDLIMVINEKRKFNVRELSEEFGVSYRTMLRDLQELSILGVPLYSELGVNGGYFLLQGRTLPPIVFTEEEAVSLYYVFQSLEFYGSIPFGSDVKKALTKFYHYLPQSTKNEIENMRGRLVFWNPLREKPSYDQNEILKASLDRKKIKITYHSSMGTKKRTILPIGMYSHNGFWYCPAFCYDKNEFRLFRSDRITAVHVEEGEEAIDDFKDVTVLDWLQPLENEGHHRLTLIIHLDQEGVRRAVADLSLGHLIMMNEDNTGMIKTTIPDKKVAYIGDLVFALGEHAVVEEPFEVITYIKEKVKRVSDLYT